MKILKGILYLLGALFFAGATAAFGLSIKIDGFGGEEPIYLLEWLLESQNAGFLYAYLALCFLLFAFGLRKGWFRSVSVRLLFVWIVYLLTMCYGLGGYDLDGDFDPSSFLEWLKASPGSMLLYVYLTLSFLFFHYGFRLVARIGWKWRILAYPAVCLLFYGLFWVTANSVSHDYLKKHYGCESLPEDNPLGERLQEQMSTIISCITNAPRPRTEGFSSQKQQEGLFDPQLYFTIFTNLSLEAGFELDYSYFKDWFAGGPRIYLRNIGETPSVEDDGDWFLKVHLNGTAESYLEYATLYLFADQFDLFSHAAQSSEGQIIVSKVAFEELINAPFLRLSPRAKFEASTINFYPRVDIDEEYVTVSFLTFKHLGREGLRRVTLVIQKVFPHLVLSEESELLIYYDCGFVI